MGQFNLGNMYLNGWGLHKIRTSRTMVRKAADQGLSVAQQQMGVMFQKGLGVEKDDAQAATHSKKPRRTATSRGDTVGVHTPAYCLRVYLSTIKPHFVPVAVLFGGSSPAPSAHIVIRLVCAVAIQLDVHMIIVVSQAPLERVAAARLAKPLPWPPDHALDFVVFAVQNTPVKQPIAMRLLGTIVEVYVRRTSFEMDVCVASSWISIHCAACREVIRLGGSFPEGILRTTSWTN